MLNPWGVKISVPNWVKRELSKMKQLAWDREQRLWKIKKSFIGLMPLLETADYKHVPYRAINYEFTRAKSPDSGRANKMLQALGHDLSGLNTPSIDELRRLRAMNENTPMPGTEPEVCGDVDRMLVEIVARRKYA